MVAVCRREIEQELPFAGRRGFEISAVEAGGHLAADFVAVAEDAGADPGKAILWTSAEGVAHRLDGFFGDPPRRALPSRMSRA